MKKNIEPKVFCKNSRYGQLDFYLIMNEEEIFMFSTSFYSSTIFNDYKDGRNLSFIFRNTKEYRQENIKKRIIRTLRYIEMEYDVQLLNKTRIGQQKKSRKHYPYAA